MDLKLRGKLILVTGSSHGIGLATARAFAAESCRIMLSARATGQLRETETDLRATGAEVAGHAADVGGPDNAARLDRGLQVDKRMEGAALEGPAGKRIGPRVLPLNGASVFANAQGTELAG